MSDDDHSPDLDLASAYLDDEVTPVERARVEGSEALLGRVQELRALRTELAAVAVPADRRDAALSAALAAFDDLHSGSEGDAPPPSVPPARATVVSMSERRRRQQRWIGGVAAAAIIAVVGIATLNSSNDDRSSDLSSSAATTAGGGSAKLAAPESAADASSAATSAASIDSTFAAPAPGSADTTADADDTAAAGAATSAQVASAWLGAPALSSPQDLVAFATGDEFDQYPVPVGLYSATTESGPPASESARTTAPAVPVCADPGLPAAVAVLSGTEVIVVRDTAARSVVAYDASTCAVVAAADLP
jgi:hypothetical protein